MCWGRTTSDRSRCEFTQTCRAWHHELQYVIVAFKGKSDMSGDIYKGISS